MSARTVRGGLAAGKYASLAIAGAVVLVPLAVVLITSLKTDREVLNSGGVLSPPHDWFNTANYATAWRTGNMLNAFKNTAVILVASVAGSVVIGAMTAYAIDRFEFRFKRLVVAAFLLASLVPSITTQVATFQVVDRLGLYDSRLAPIALYTGTDIVSIYIFLQFIRSVPRSLDEVARLDGASSWRIFWRIIFPLLKPAVATVVIIKGIAVYNDFYIPFLYMPSQNLGTISTSFFRWVGPYGSQWNVISAALVIIIVPTLAAFLFLQRFIYGGLARGATR